MRYTKIALSVAMFAAALSTQAADIQIYGRVDSGLMFTDAEGEVKDRIDFWRSFRKPSWL